MRKGQLQLLGGGVRKAYKSKGDDVTLSRFVKTGLKKRHQPRQAKLPGMESAFIQEARTKFGKSVKAPTELSNLLVSGHSNAKIGRDVRKGHLRGYWIYTLSLEERKTCPITCQHWQSCYGNNMPFAQRVDHTHPEFLPMLEAQVAKLCQTQRRGADNKMHDTGILVRLHALGDFYSLDYVDFWDRMLFEHKNLAIYGYTAYSPFSILGWAIKRMNREFGERCMVRFSNGQVREMATVSIGSEESCPKDAFICPEQTGKTAACATCGACWATKKNVAFLEH